MAIVFLAAVVWSFSPSATWAQTASDAPTQSEQNGWSALDEKKGWIMLGIRHKDGTWETKPSFVTVLASDHTIPKPNDEIVLTNSQQLIIVGFQPRRSMAKIKEHPAKNGVVRAEDVTGVVFKAGFPLRIDAIEYGAVKDEDGLAVVWARVVPSTSHHQ
jgi:hypothetical protein